MDSRISFAYVLSISSSCRFISILPSMIFQAACVPIQTMQKITNINAISKMFNFITSLYFRSGRGAELEHFLRKSQAVFLVGMEPAHLRFEILSEADPLDFSREPWHPESSTRRLPVYLHDLTAPLPTIQPVTHPISMRPPR